MTLSPAQCTIVKRGKCAGIIQGIVQKEQSSHKKTGRNAGFLYCIILCRIVHAQQSPHFERFEHMPCLVAISSGIDTTSQDFASSASATP